MNASTGRKNASIEIITIGTELLLGTTIDGNSAHIGRVMAEIGLDVYAKHSVGDNQGRLRQMLIRALDDAGGVITTGGLGPTVDDLTKEAIAETLGVPLELHEPSLRAIETRFARLGREVGENNRRQAMLPRGAQILENPHGTAPGFVVVRADGKFVAAMPGVPREMRPMLGELLVPWLREYFGLRGGIFTRSLRTVGIPESEIDRRIEHLFRSQENPKIAVLAHGGSVDVKIMAKAATREEAAAMTAPLETQLRAAIGEGIFGVDDQTLADRVVATLKRRGMQLALAESCTGGAIADALVGVAGASEIFRGGVVAYANDAKEHFLDVPHAVLVAAGAVSEATAIAMADGARNRFGATVALSTTGIAGPGGGTAEKPVGLVWMALAREGVATTARSFHFSGDRGDIRLRSVVTALAWLWEMSIA